MVGKTQYSPLYNYKVASIGFYSPLYLVLRTKVFFNKWGLEATFWNIILMISSLCTPRAILRWQRTERCDFARSQLFGLARFFFA